MRGGLQDDTFGTRQPRPTMRLVCLTVMAAAVCMPASAQPAADADAALALGDTTAAFEILQGGADDPETHLRLAEMYLRGWGTPADTVAALDELGRVTRESGWTTLASLVRIAEITRGDAVRVVARQEVAPGLVVVTTSIPVLPTYWAGTDCYDPPSRVLGEEGDLPQWRIARIVLERAGTTLILDSRCMGQDWPVSGTGDFLTYRIADEAAVPTGRRWLRGQFADGAATYVVRWDLETGERRQIGIAD